ncbi:hypothetical protein E2986_02795 [Frieseomelitta varia]|uniref:Uncharacterized protein n=1 Tax=Frieseomelitta varia TaxID=561572 RepID=A0A833WBF6_9HYME|nr:hypothetical protein E2986_02795 [Frieseomelitta varia]
MSQRFVCALLTASVVCCALAENNELAAVSEFVKKQSTEDKPSSNVVHGKNSSKTCCGSRYGSNSSTRPDSHYSRIPGDSSRYPTKFGERLPFDRYGWQTQGSLSGSIGRPGSGNYAGTAFGSRPSYGSEGSRKPGGYDSSVSGGYGYANSGFGGYSFNRPTGYAGSTGGYGISGTFANGDEFGPVEPNRPEGHTPSYPNINAQKAVALKALAGVALIGAAAALATNPVLLPLGVVSGRRKRSSVSIKDRDAYMNYIMNLKSNVTKLDDKDGNKISVSPTCVARLTCEIQKNYWINRKKDANFLKERSALERHLNNLLLNSVPNEEFVNARIKSLVKAATIVASNGENCSTFTCTFLKNKKAKSFVFKL